MSASIALVAGKWVASMVLPMVGISLLNRWMEGDGQKTDATAVRLQAEMLRKVRGMEGEASSKALETWKMSTAEQRALEREMMRAGLDLKYHEIKNESALRREEMQKMLESARMGASASMGTAGIGALGGLGQQALQNQALLSSPDAGSSWTQGLPQPLRVDTQFQMGGGY